VGTLAASGSDARAVGRVTGVRPKLWSPQAPNLYRVVVQAGRAGADTLRVGFRSIRAANGQILLNGRPLFLRGNAINPPGRNIPDSLDENPRFARAYLRYMKGLGLNIIRLTTPSQPWFDAADEEGMLIFQGHYGTPRGGTSTSPPKDVAAALRWYRDSVVAPQANHPSVVIYTLSNEQAAPEIGYLSRGHAEVARFLQTVYDTLKQWDDTRLYIGNAGYGFGRAGEVCDLHRYWGWYYNSYLSFYTLRDPKICWRSDAVQPITLTENTGNYTGPDGRYNLVSDTKQPDSQLNWTGHAPDEEQPARALAYQAWMGGQAIEITRRLRERNPYLAGLSPFTIVFSKWHGITRFEDMAPKPVAEQYRRSFQPVLLSWESWTPHAYAGTTITPVAHVVNDADDGQAVRGAVLHWSLVDSARGARHAAGTLALPDVPYYGAASRRVSVAIPAGLSTGTYTLAGAVVRGGRDTISRNETRVFIAERTFARPRELLTRVILLYDSPAGRTAAALRALGVPFTPVSADRLKSLESPPHQMLIIGSGAWDSTLTREAAALRRFAQFNGRVLILDQRAGQFDASWLPGGLRVQTAALDHPHVFPGGRPFAQGMAINPERPEHPVFDGLTRDRLFLLSDYTGWDESKPGFPAVYPVAHGLDLTKPDEMDSVAVLANYDHGLQGVALAELSYGAGRVLVSAFDVVERVGRDPVADRLLLNMVGYMHGPRAGADHGHAHRLIDSKIVWGDYASERGVVTGIHSGLLVHTVPRVPAELAARNPIRVDEQGFVFAGGAGGWNTRPAIQYFARGRRPFGPYTYTTGGSVQLPKDHGPEGVGRVWMRVPFARTTMITTVENLHDQPLEIEIGLNGATRRHRVDARSTARIETLLPSRDPASTWHKSLALTFRGDRRLVLLETDFK
jgi:beta-galactosidase